MLTQLLCTDIQPPPEVPPFIPPTPTARTVRQRAEQQMQAPGTVCATCHGTINPIGFGFENYDAIGRYRTMEKTDPIDATGTIRLGGRKVAFASGVELARALAAAPEVSDCVATQLVRYGLARPEQPDDAGALATAQQTLRKGGSVRDLLTALVQTRSFTHRLVAAGEPL